MHVQKYLITLSVVYYCKAAFVSAASSRFKGVEILRCIIAIMLI